MSTWCRPPAPSTTVAVNAPDPDGEPVTLTVDDDPSPLTIDVDGLMLTITAPLDAASTTYDLQYTVTDPVRRRRPRDRC